MIFCILAQAQTTTNLSAKVMLPFLSDVVVVSSGGDPDTKVSNESRFQEGRVGLAILWEDLYITSNLVKLR